MDSSSHSKIFGRKYEEIEEGNEIIGKLYLGTLNENV